MALAIAPFFAMFLIFNLSVLTNPLVLPAREAVPNLMYLPPEVIGLEVPIRLPYMAVPNLFPLEELVGLLLPGLI